MSHRLAVAALIAIALMSALGHALSQRAPTVYARFADADNLASGAPVRTRGAVVGKLATVETEAGGTALVEIELREEPDLVIPMDSVAIVAPGGIDLILGDSTDPAGPDTVLKGYKTLTEFRVDSARGGVDELFDRLQGEAERLGKTLQEKGEQAGEVLREELERLREELEKVLPEGERKSTPETKSI